MNNASCKPFVVKAFYDWILDGQYTPYLLVQADYAGVKVPQQYVNEEHQIVLDLRPSAVDGLVIGVHKNNPSSRRILSFNASFGGIMEHIIVPYDAVLGIYAQETGDGMMFELPMLEDSEEAEVIDVDRNEPVKKKKTKVPDFLRIIK